jgi:hypothetical protein
MSACREVPALRVGVSALFNPADTPHARTFLRALCVARNFMPGLSQVQWHFLDDGASALRGAEVARQMVEWKADVVVGHFSSDAAISAAALYHQAAIPLLTPAATIDALTLEHPNAFRFCPSDRQLAADLLAWLPTQGWQVLHISADDSAHGSSLAASLCEAAKSAGLCQVTNPDKAQVEIFAGRLGASREHWRAHRAAGSTRPLVFTDDALSPQIGAAQHGDLDSYVIGFGEPDAQSCVSQARYRLLFGSKAPTYFRESLLMFYVLEQLATGSWRKAELSHALNHTTFDTPLGQVGFDRGECRGTFNRIWRIGPTGLIPLSG